MATIMEVLGALSQHFSSEAQSLAEVEQGIDVAQLFADLVRPGPTCAALEPGALERLDTQCICRAELCAVPHCPQQE